MELARDKTAALEAGTDAATTNIATLLPRRYRRLQIVPSFKTVPAVAL
jgi:hypothetical protein